MIAIFALLLLLRGADDMMQTLTLLTDFGIQDAYVGIMKGVIATISPHTQLIDITHDIAPQDLITARFQWMNAYPYFPKGTIHLGVVDPGVGSDRRAVALQMPSGYIVAPDNGLASGILDIEDPIAIVELDNPEYWRIPQPSHTFHGRDIFAPAAAHLSNGVPLKELGSLLTSLVRLPIPRAKQIQPNQWEGCIQAIDRFGNLITNLHGDLIAGETWSIDLGEALILGQTTYANAKHHEAVGLIGSENWIEIAVRNGNAQELFSATVRDSVKLTLS